MLTSDDTTGILERSSRSKRLRPERNALSDINRFADGALICAGLWIACILTATPITPSLAGAAAILLALYYALAIIKNLYRSWRTHSVGREAWSLLEAWFSAATLPLIAVYTIQDTGRYPPETILLWFLGAPMLLIAWRTMARQAFRWSRARGHNLRNLAIAGSGDLAQHLARTVKENPWMGFRIIGLFDDISTPEAGRNRSAHPVNRGSLSDLTKLTRNGEVNVVYIALPPGEAERNTDSLIRRLSDSTASVYLVQDRRTRDPDNERGSLQVAPDLWRIDILHRRIIDIAGIKAVSIYETPFHGTEGWIKRIEDIVVSSVALLILAIPMAAIALGVKLSGPGPVIFKQRRYGLDGREIIVWKFRTMTVCEDDGKIVQAKKNDARVTPIGGFLRRTSLDELPQFVNALSGSMSVVGPRPHAVSHNEQYRELIGGYMLRHKVKPGITGWAQVHGFRGETDSIEKMGRRIDFDLDYIRNWSLWLDVQIIFMTVYNGFAHRNAY